MKTWLGRIAVIALCGALAWVLLGPDDPIDAVFGGRGDMTTEAAVIEALDELPYEIRYRKVPRVEGYEMVAGRARSKAGGVVDFSVVLREAGQFESAPESQRGGSPQFPVVRYMEGSNTITGNSNVVTQAQGSYVVAPVEGLGRVWLPRGEERRMSIRMEEVIEDLFAPNLEGGP